MDPSLRVGRASSSVGRVRGMVRAALRNPGGWGPSFLQCWSDVRSRPVLVEVVSSHRVWVVVRSPEGSDSRFRMTRFRDAWSAGAVPQVDAASGR